MLKMTPSVAYVVLGVRGRYFLKLNKACTLQALQLSWCHTKAIQQTPLLKISALHKVKVGLNLSLETGVLVLQMAYIFSILLHQNLPLYSFTHCPSSSVILRTVFSSPTVNQFPDRSVYSLTISNPAQFSLLSFSRSLYSKQLYSFKPYLSTCRCEQVPEGKRK